VELPRLEPLYQKYKDRGFRVVIIDGLNMTAAAREFIAANKLTYTLLENGKDNAEIVRNLFGVTVFPTSFLIDRNGRIVRLHIGFEAGDEEKLEKEILALLEE
jgi:peroxiredoxin